MHSHHSPFTAYQTVCFLKQTPSVVIALSLLYCTSFQAKENGRARWRREKKREKLTKSKSVWKCRIHWSFYSYEMCSMPFPFEMLNFNLRSFRFYLINITLTLSNWILWIRNFLLVCTLHTHPLPLSLSLCLVRNFIIAVYAYILNSIASEINCYSKAKQHQPNHYAFMCRSWSHSLEKKSSSHKILRFWMCAFYQPM